MCVCVSQRATVHARTPLAILALGEHAVCLFVCASLQVLEHGHRALFRVTLDLRKPIMGAWSHAGYWPGVEKRRNLT